MNTPPKSVLVLAVAILAVGIVVFVWKATYRPEPVYKGKALTHWAQQYGSNNWRAGGREAAAEAQLAIQQIGTNGVPFLLDLIRTKESPTKTKLRNLLPPSWHTRLRLNDKGDEIRRTGAHGLAALGTNAPAAVPYLIQIASSHSEDDGRYIAAFTLRAMGHAAEPAIPFLVQCLTNRMETIRDEAALALGYLRLRHEIVVPALTDYLNAVIAAKAFGWEFQDAVASLSEFGTNATPAVPALLGLLNHSDAKVRSQVTNALALIDRGGDWTYRGPRR